MSEETQPFELHPRLAQDSIHITDWPLSQVRVMNDRQFPWFLLIPRVPNVTEIIDLNDADQQQLWRESAFLSHWLKAEYRPEKLNIAAIGNKVPQLHLHHIGRFSDDLVWPDPVWGRLPPKPLAEETVTRLQEIFKALSL